MLYSEFLNVNKIFINLFFHALEAIKANTFSLLQYCTETLYKKYQ